MGFHKNTATFFSPKNLSVSVLRSRKTLTATSTNMSLRNTTSHYPKCFAVISFRSLCTVWANYRQTGFIRAVSEKKYRMKDSHLYVHIVVKPEIS